MSYKKPIFSFLLFSQIIMAQGEAGSVFLAINPGARANGMGEAQIGVADDVYSTYYNPAGLSNLSTKEFSFVHTNYLPNLVDDMAYDFLAFAMPFKENSAIGGHFTYLDLGDQINTDDNGNELGSFSSYMYALNVSYSQKVNEYSSWGVNGKYFYQELADLSDIDAATGSVAVDVGYFRRMNNPNLTMGAVLTNLGPDVSFGDGEGSPLPTRLGVGIGFLVFEGAGNLAFDFNYELNDQAVVTNLGFEYSIVENFALRAGFMNDSSGDLSYATIGLGARLDPVGFDISYVIGGDLDPHSDMVRFSLSGSF